MPNAMRSSERRLIITAHLDETMVMSNNSETGEMRSKMRLVFNTTLAVDVPANDEPLRKAFIDLVTQNARAIYGPAAMLARSKPNLKITETSREGMKDIDLFEEALPSE